MGRWLLSVGVSEMYGVPAHVGSDVAHVVAGTDPWW